MDPKIVIIAAIAAAVPAHFVGSCMLRGGVTREAGPDSVGDIEVLLARAEALARDQGELGEKIEIASRPVPGQRIDDAAIARAVEPWLARKAAIEAAEAAEAAARQPAAVASLPVPELIRRLRAVRPFSGESEAVYKALRKAKRIDELLEAAEALVDSQPDDSDLHVFLGVVYLQKLFTLGVSMESGRFAMQADASFNEALELNPRSTSARFTKAVSLSNWPEFLGKTKPAIKQFEILIEQLEQPGGENFAAPYLYLGNMYKRIGDTEQARAAWLAGQKLFPSDAGLKQALK